MIATVVAGGRVMLPGADPHAPPDADILIDGDRIAAIGAPGELHIPAGARVIDASGLLVSPGFVNAHYHSYDVLQKGLLEDMPFDVWALHSQPAISRRAALRGAALGSIALMTCNHPAHAAESHIKSTYGSGFCNLNFYLTNALQTAQTDGLILDFVTVPTFAEQVTFLGAGQVDAGLMPYTSFIALYDAGAPVKIVAGGGIQGCILVAQPGLDTPAKLKGKTLGTFQLDTLEVLPYDWFKKNGVNFKDITVRYMGNTPEAVEAFRAGAIDMICTVEPYGTALLNDVKGSVMLSDGLDIYGPGYTDCVLAVSDNLIKTNPAGIKALIKGMMVAQHMAETEPQKTLDRLVGSYYKTSMENAKIAMAKQPSVVDARSQTDFILERVNSIMEMGYIKTKPGRGAIDWTLLEQVIAENPDLYSKLKLKSA